LKAAHIVVAGGGAAGFFGAISAAEKNPQAKVVLLEKGAHLLTKVRISGGGRCNVTHACYDPRELSHRYPRGGKALIGPLTRFGPEQTVAWFASRGVKLKTEADGRMFPVTNSSQSVIECLTQAARKAGVSVITQSGIQSVATRREGGFILRLSTGADMECHRLLWATGGCGQGPHPLTALGHHLNPPVPSLFTFHLAEDWIRSLAGLSIQDTKITVSNLHLEERGPVLFTHEGLSGPAVLRLSAWGARPMHEKKYCFPLSLDWIPGQTLEKSRLEIQSRRQRQGAKTLYRSGWPPLPARLWEQLCRSVGITPDERWSKFSREKEMLLLKKLHETKLEVVGKSMNKEEFVTCGGIPLEEVDMKTMESRKVPGLYFAGETLDIDGITGGFNFQAAWTTAWMAGQSIAGDG
jgi:predicted Rossmann fold flavoprotein